MRALGELDERGACVTIEEAKFPAPFVSGLEYAAPARGTWNIVHIGMLLPESHQIFVCAQACLRGVVLTAAEMGASDRFSTISVEDHNLLDGDMETLIIEGTTDILNRMPERPRAVLIYTSCVHHFIGCDLDYVYRRLREKFPDVDFTDCYMNPIMRKSKMTPDSKMRMQLYSLTLYQNRLERLYTESVKGRGTVEHYRMFLDDSFEHVPYLRSYFLDHSLGTLDIVSVAVFHELLHDERLEQFERHLLRQTALIEFQLRSYYDYRTSRVVYTLSEKVLSESSLFSLEHIRQRLERSRSRTCHRSSSSAVIYESVNSFLEHSLLVSYDDVRSSQFKESVESVVSVYNTSVKVIQV